MFGDDDFEPARKPLWQRVGVPALILIFVSTGAVGIVSLLKSHGPGPRPHVEPPHITTIRLPPPPPPPPPPPKPQKPEEKPKEDVKVQPRLQMPKAAPHIPSPPQALTAVAGAGNDAFGLKAGEGGGGDCVGTDCGNGDGGGDAGPYYEELVRSLVKDTLARIEKLQHAHYRGTVSLVFDASGHVKDVTVQSFDGDPDVRVEVTQALSHMAATESFPADMANGGKPWVVRLTAHAPG